MVKRKRVELLGRREEKKKIKKTVYLTIGTAILVVFLFTLGIPLLGKFADLLDLAFGKKATENSSQSSDLDTPRLDNLPEATNSATLEIGGFVLEDSDVEIFINNEKSGNTKASGGRFSYDEGRLKEGSNEIKARTVGQSKQGEFSKPETITLDREEPKLEIENPSEGQAFVGVSRISVTGKTDKDAQVFANGFLANVDADGSFEVFVVLNEGENTIEIKAVDSAGNTKVEKRKVQYGK